ncbi:MAG: carbohydrate-binding family 9-like protein [Tannerellaceae bacterium]|nr:carbohydrate-binding family 9-like protein [Tannerellaceae bacterium]
MGNKKGVKGVRVVKELRRQGVKLKVFLTPLTTLATLITLTTFSSCREEKREISYDLPVTFNPPAYICYKAPAAITIDGILSPEEWDLIPCTSAFVDIAGDAQRKPFLQTRVKMTYNDKGLYLAAMMEEPQIRADMTVHDSPLYLNNNFEFFFNPTNDTHNYVEYEVNALGTEWDLFLTKPYRDGGLAFSNWEFMGMKSAVHINGTLNNPDDMDTSWSVEIFLPWQSVYQLKPGKNKPEAGEQIRANFSRAEWEENEKDGDKKGNDYFWAWAPSNVKNIHMPEFWGFIQLSDRQAGTGEETFIKHPDEETKWILRNLYYRQNQYYKAFGEYATSLADLKADDVCPEGSIAQLTLKNTPSMYEITLPSPNGRVWSIRQDGLVWSN